MEIKKTKQHFVYELLPSFVTDLSSVTTETALKQLVQKLLSDTVDLVFPDSEVVIKSQNTTTRLGVQLTKSSFINKVEASAIKYNNEAQKTMQAILRSIEQHEEKLRIINSSQFQFATVNNELDQDTQELALRIKDTIQGLRRRAMKAMIVEQSMSVKVDTMLDQSIAALQIQQQPQAHLVQRLTHDYLIENKHHQDFSLPDYLKLSYYTTLVGVVNQDTKWHWDFVFSDGSRSVEKPISILSQWKEHTIQPKQNIHIIRALFSKSSFYQSALVALEFIDFQGATILQTKLFKDYYETPNQEQEVREFELHEYERIIGVKSSRRGSPYHYDFQFVIGRLE